MKQPGRDSPDDDHMTPEQRKEAANSATELFDSVAPQRTAQPLPPTAIVLPPAAVTPPPPAFTPPPPTHIPPPPMEHKMEKAEPKEPAPRGPAAQVHAHAQIPADAGGHTMILGLGAGKVEACVGWLVVVDGPGKGSYRTIYSGSNTIGRNKNQRIPVDFGDDSISGDQQAFLVYDARKRQFQLVPNLGRPNLVHLNDSALLTGAVLKASDRITMGRTTLMFVPLCGPDFEWGDTK